MPPELAAVLSQLAFARRYTLRLLDSVPEDDWFAMPGGVTHVGWQVGHLAMAEYRLGLERTRGPRPDDEAVLSAAFRAKFLRDSVPDPDPAAYPPPADLRAALDRVHAQLLAEFPSFAALDLSAAPETPHALAATKLACLVWCGQHEMVHAGQIGLLRRMLGRPPVW